MLRSEFNKKLARFLVAIGAIGVSQRISGENIPSDAVKIIDFYIAGYVYYKGESIESRLQNNMLLTLRLEKNNEYDSNAIEVYYYNNKLGYVPRQYNEIIANIITSNKKIYIRIEEINKNKPTWERVKTAVLVL